MYNLSGKVILITGSTAGLGRQLAFTLSKDGALIIINGRSKEKLQQTQLAFQKMGIHVLALQGDVAQHEDCNRIINACITKFGKLDILINNAGTGSNGLFIDTIPQASKKIIETNILGSIYPSFFALPHIKKTGGSIIFISSLAGIFGIPYCAHYSASKMALTAFTQALRIELASTNIHVGIIYVGFLKNDPDKKVVGCDGSLISPGLRPKNYTMPEVKSSKIIVKAIKKRKSKKILSNLGHILFIVNYLSPFLVGKILEKTMHKMRNVYIPEKIELLVD
jgi:meso-butanediol dehydrogenase/(S,S)-butanediol dehydrogenase/diacetyl reductase